MKLDTRPRCRHCQVNLAKKGNSRLLCFGCMKRAGIRVLYPPTLVSKYVRRGHGTEEPTRETEPTPAMPGTPEKMETLFQRLANGEQLYHPHDAGYRKDY